MYEAHSLKSIVDNVSRQLPQKISFTKKEPVIEMGMIIAGAPPSRTKYKNVTVEEERDTKVIGILLCHPESVLAKTEIIGHLSHFHYQSGDAVDFYCAGYGAYWPPNHFIDQKVVTKIDDTEWLFSDKAFSEFIQELEDTTKWKYSGETELILLPARKENNSVVLDYKTAITCNLEEMYKDNAFSSVRAFFTKIFRFSKLNSEKNPLWAYSDLEGYSVVKSALKNAILSILPVNLKDTSKKLGHFAIKKL